MRDHVPQRRKAAVVVEAAFLMGPEAVQRRGPVAVIGGPVGPEVIDSDLGRRMQIPAGLAGDGLDMAPRTIGFACKECCPTRRGCLVETPGRRLGRRNRQLVKMKRRQFGAD